MPTTEHIVRHDSVFCQQGATLDQLTGRNFQTLEASQRRKRDCREAGVATFGVGFGGIGDAHHHDKVLIAGGRVAPFDHLVRGAAFGGAVDGPVATPLGSQSGNRKRPYILRAATPRRIP